TGKKLVYCKSDLNWQRETRSQQQGVSSSQGTSGLHEHPGGRVPHQSQGSEKEARQTTGFSSAGVTTTGRSTTRQPAVEGQRTPGQRGSSGFQLETADGGGDTLPKP